MANEVPLLQLEGVDEDIPERVDRASRSRSGSVARHGARVAGRKRRRQIDSHQDSLRLACSHRRTNRLEGRRGRIFESKGANDMGIATIHQHIPLVPTLSVLENMFLGEEGRWRRNTKIRRTVLGIVRARRILA